MSQSAPALGWGSPLHAWLASVNWIGGARYLNRGYRYGARDMHYHILLRPYSQNYYTYNSAVKNTYSPCHKDACVQISIGNTEWLLRYKSASETCFSGEKACFHRERWLGENPARAKFAAENICDIHIYATMPRNSKIRGFLSWNDITGVSVSCHCVCSRVVFYSVLFCLGVMSTIFLVRAIHFMMTSSNGNIFRVTGNLCGEFTGPGEFPAQRPVTRSFDGVFDLHLNKRLNKHSWGWWFETLSRPLWRHCNVLWCTVVWIIAPMQTWMIRVIQHHSKTICGQCL